MRVEFTPDEARAVIKTIETGSTANVDLYALRRALRNLTDALHFDDAKRLKEKQHRFTAENTFGYDEADLVMLNDAYAAGMELNGLQADTIDKSASDVLAERVLTAFDNGDRGVELIAATRI